MKIEIKSVKYFPSLSEETNCFQAVVYIDGKRAGTVENRGCGGPTDYHFDDRSMGEKLEAYAKSLPPVVSGLKLDNGEPFIYPQTGETIFDDLLNAHLLEKERKKMERFVAKEKARIKAAGFIPVKVVGANAVVMTSVRSAEQAEAAAAKIAEKNKWKEHVFEVLA